jgi:signal transduction histidine kinase
MSSPNPPPDIASTDPRIWAALVRANRWQTYTGIIRGIVHEIANPAQAVILAAGGIARASGLSAEHRLVAMVEAEGQRLSDLLSEFRGLVSEPRPSADRIVLEDALRSVMVLQGHQRAWPNVTVSLVVHGGPLPSVRADLARVQHVLLSLLTNAKEALAEGRGEVEVSARAEDGGVVVEVRDTGPGIPAERREWVFELFATTREGAGAGAPSRGLGLTVARLLVGEVGGTLTAEEPAGGGGGRLVLRLPVARV